MSLVKVYKSIGVFFFIIPLLFQTFSKSLMLVDYYFNTQDYAIYCINKGKPEKHCDGQCLLSKKMNEMDHQQDRLLEGELTGPMYVILDSKSLESLSEIIDKTVCSPYYSRFYIKDFISSLFRPPR